MCDQVEDRAVMLTHYIVFYMAGGSVREYDLTDPRVPLPRFRSLVADCSVPSVSSRQKVGRARRLTSDFIESKNTMRRSWCGIGGNNEPDNRD